ncbi:MAG: transposase [Arenicellales bacterium]
MARLPRLCPAGVPLHIIHRGNNRQVCFVYSEDYQNYLGFLSEGALKYGVSIHAWVLMTNHVHILATSHQDGSISRMMQYLGRYYVRYYNAMYGRTGTLWEGRFKSCVVDSDTYFLTCQRYIELNPVRAGMVNEPSEYRWCSYQSNAHGVKCDFLTPHEVYLELGKDMEDRRAVYRGLFAEGLDSNMVDELRKATQKNLGFGRDRFKEEIELLYGRRVKPEKTGPKK